MSGVACYKQRHGTTIGDPRGGAESRAPSCAYGLTQWLTREPSTSQDDPSMRTRKWDPCHYDVTAYPFIRTCSLMKCSPLRAPNHRRSAASSRATVISVPLSLPYHPSQLVGERRYAVLKCGSGPHPSFWTGPIVCSFLLSFLKGAIESLWTGPRAAPVFAARCMNGYYGATFFEKARPQ